MNYSRQQKKLRPVQSLLFNIRRYEKPICSLMNKFKLIPDGESYMPHYSINWHNSTAINQKPFRAISLPALDAPTIALSQKLSNIQKTQLKLRRKPKSISDFTN